MGIRVFDQNPDAASAEQRNRLIERAIALKREILTDLNATTYWNEHIRKRG